MRQRRALPRRREMVSVEQLQPMQRHLRRGGSGWANEWNFAEIAGKFRLIVPREELQQPSARARRPGLRGRAPTDAAVSSGRLPDRAVVGVDPVRQLLDRLRVRNQDEVR